MKRRAYYMFTKLGSMLGRTSKEQLSQWLTASSSSQAITSNVANGGGWLTAG